MGSLLSRRWSAINFSTMIVLIIISGSGCSTYYIDFDAELAAAVGKLSQEVKYPQIDGAMSERHEGNVLIREYWLSALGKCRWEFVFSVDSGRILGWRYPDIAAERACHQLPRSMT